MDGVVHRGQDGGLGLRRPRSGGLRDITGSYGAAFIYENELQDLFGVKVEGLNLDFKGHFYMKAMETPFIKQVASQDRMEAPRG